jgi:hypothetical protein
MTDHDELGSENGTLTLVIEPFTERLWDVPLIKQFPVAAAANGAAGDPETVVDLFDYLCLLFRGQHPTRTGEGQFMLEDVEQDDWENSKQKGENVITYLA